MPVSVTLLGATGLVGRECLLQLLRDDRFGRVVTVGRRALPAELSGDSPRDRLEQRVVDMDHLADGADAFATDRVVCALGTTMKQAGSRDAFRHVDYELPLEAARIALARGAAHFLLVSAIGADAGSRIFYNRVKGEVERDVLALPFRATTVVRPSLLLGARDEFRAGELAAKAVGRLIPGRWRAVRARDVARVLVEEAASERAGARVIESDEIRRLAAGLERPS